MVYRYGLAIGTASGRPAGSSGTKEIPNQSTIDPVNFFADAINFD